MATNKFTDDATLYPPKFSWDNAKVEPSQDGRSLRIVMPSLLTWTRTLVEPEKVEGKSGEELKYSLTAAVPKLAAAHLIKRIRDAADTAAIANGIKAGVAYPNFLRDGGQIDAATGDFAKQGGALADYLYFNVKTKRAPEVFAQSDIGNTVANAEILKVGGYAAISMNVIFVTYGVGNAGKLGSSAWLNRILWLGGGEQRESVGGASEGEDFGGYAPTAGTNQFI